MLGRNATGTKLAVHHRAPSIWECYIVIRRQCCGSTYVVRQEIDSCAQALPQRFGAHDLVWCSKVGVFQYTYAPFLIG